ncbi:MAG: glycosyltransferase family 4 protein [Candidatus Thalassarchaeum sp.]|nr:glycosyltransferase family 4 protein [Candidatus Thalassarchaeum sp.]
MTSNGEHGPSAGGLVVAKGSFAAMGGAERDLMRNLPAFARRFSVTVATLHPVPELESLCSELGIPLISPDKAWKMPTDALSTVLDSGNDTAAKAWQGCSGLAAVLATSDAVHLVSGDGSLALLEHLPDSVAVHLHLLEPHRGLHENVLHREIDGSPKRSLGLTSALLSRARRRDIEAIRGLTDRSCSAISGNSSYTAARIGEVYGVEAGVLLPSVVSDEFPAEAGLEEPSEIPDIANPYAVSVGRASWVKGAWETVSMLAGSGVSLAHVGGGAGEDLARLIQHAESCGVDLWIAPRLSSPEMAALMRGARAVVSMAHGEPFGLTPVESISVGTPALMVDEGGFRDTVIDGVNGRLLPRDDLGAWHSALEQVADDGTRTAWAESGRTRIAEMDLSPDAHCHRLESILHSL